VGEREFASHQYGPGSIPAWCHMWVEFVVGSRLAPRVFLQVLRFFSLHKKPTFPNVNLTSIEDPNENQLRLTWLPL